MRFGTGFLLAVVLVLSVADMARLAPGADLALVDEGTKHVTAAGEEVRSSMIKSATNLMLA